MNKFLHYSRLPLVLVFTLLHALSLEVMAQNQYSDSYAKDIILEDAEKAILSHDWVKVDKSMDAVDSMIKSNDTISELQKILLYAQLHIEIGNLTKAKEELEASQKILERTEVLNTLQIELLTKANILYSRLHLLEDEPEEAIKKLNKSKNILTTAVDELYYSLIDYEEAKIALHQKDFFTALQKLEKSLIYFEKNNKHFYLTQCLNHIAEAYLGLGEVDEAEKFALTALNNAKTFNIEINAMYTYKILSDIYKTKEQPEFALSNLELYNDTKNRLNNRQNILDTEDKFAQKILEDKNQTIRELNAYVKELELIQRKKNMTYVMMLGMISILGLFSFFLYKNYTFRNRTNKALVKKNIQLTKERDQA
ncbi:MAG: hypothetical protein RQ756_07105, partial [Flavobacteriaceae bacterium]|nr:hypothetical protein [Flavobacteriaceae bacterium]